MSQIVLFGLPADEARVRKVVEALLAQHLDIWWEKSAPDSDAAKEALSMAKCVVFFWSSQSLKDTAYVHLATEVEVAVRQGVVEEAERRPRVRPGGDVERDVGSAFLFRPLLDTRRWSCFEHHIGIITSHRYTTKWHPCKGLSIRTRSSPEKNGRRARCRPFRAPRAVPDDHGGRRGVPPSRRRPPARR